MKYVIRHENPPHEADTSEESAYIFACFERGFSGNFAAWLAMPRDERAEYEDGEADTPTA